MATFAALPTFAGFAGFAGFAAFAAFAGFATFSALTAFTFARCGAFGGCLFTPRDFVLVAMLVSYRDARLCASTRLRRPYRHLS
ncbi:MAG: hypothetical protein IT370_31650 [Deltaproteobacteria bacterium]|nr:hypothetical protein [Deltaproteobacteria bacterium]